MNLFLIGKAVVENADTPNVSSLKESLNMFDMGYHMNHRLDGKIMFDPATGRMLEGIGHYKLTHFDAKKKEAVLVCNTPYPSKFDEGVITQVVRTFKPGPSRDSVTLDPTKPTRTKGADSCTYNISW